MLTHVTLELPQVTEAAGLPIVSFNPSSKRFPLTRLQDWSRQSIFGHSMGGHGALTIYLASKTRQYRSVSAFSPISNPSKCPWGEKAFNGYLQGGVEEGRQQYDATELIARHKDPVHVLIDYVRLSHTTFFRLSKSFNRVLPTTFINKVNFYQRTSLKLQRVPDMMKYKSGCAVMKVMTTVTTS